jgi:hypothetical protein
MNYDDHTRILEVQLMDGERWLFHGVPREIYYGLPTGQNALLYIKHKVYGRFAITVTKPGEEPQADAPETAGS